MSILMYGQVWDLKTVCVCLQPSNFLLDVGEVTWVFEVTSTVSHWWCFDLPIVGGITGHASSIHTYKHLPTLLIIMDLWKVK